MKRLSTRMIGSVSLCACVLLAACGVPADDSPRVIPDDRVPAELRATSTTAPPVTTLPQTVEIDVFMLQNSRLVLVKRNVIAPPNVGSALAAVLQGPNASESASGLRSAVSGQTSVLGAQTAGNIATVNVGTAFVQLPPSAQIEALAQIVFTVTGLPDVGSVQISLNGTKQSVPDGDGSPTTEPLTRDDYTALAP